MRLLSLTVTILTSLLLISCGVSAKQNPEVVKTPRVAQTSVAKIPFLPECKDGYTVSRWADVPNARSLAVSPDGKVVFVGSRSGWVSKVEVGEDGQPTVSTFQENLNSSNGVCFVGDDLYLGELTRIRRFKGSDGFPSGAEGEVVLDGLPAETHHGWRYIRQGPDGRLRIAIGAPCNVCERKDDPRFATICSFDTEGKDFRIEAKGVRNSVGFDWKPGSRDLVFTDNGRDHLGDDIPPCELNILPSGREGSHYGFPYFWGDNQADPKFGDKAPDLEFVQPIVKFQAHVAPLGCYFLKGDKAREDFGDSIYVAQHGSWNRSSPVGYRVVAVDLEQEKKEIVPFLWGFLDSDDPNKRYGRPVDIAELPDGTMLVSDDFGGVVWAVRKK